MTIGEKISEKEIAVKKLLLELKNILNNELIYFNHFKLIEDNRSEYF